MIKTEFMQLLEELDRINEATDKAADRKFWAAAKNRQIDEVSFHAAYDDELKELGLMDVFNADGTFTSRSVYGRIKEAKDANPDSWALKALSKLWALRYVDRVYFPSEAAAIKAANDEAEKRRKADQEERARVAQETKTNAINEYTRDYKILMPEVLKEINQDLLNKYMSIYKVSESDFDVVIEASQWGDSIKILPNKSGNAYRFDSSVVNKFKELKSLVYSEIKSGVDKAAAEEARIKGESNKAIDVFRYNEDATAVLLGDSGKLYYLGLFSGRKESDNFTSVKYVSEVPEAYKVIYTRVSTADSRNSNSTYQDKISYSYESWDSSEADKISEFIPKIGKGEGTWNYWITTKVNAGNGKNYSLMDGIDSWAHTEHTSLATD